MILITDKHRVSVDIHLNHVLEKLAPAGVVQRGKHVGKESEERWVVEGYFPNLQQALRRVIALRAREGQDEVEMVLWDYLQLLNGLDEKYSALLKKPLTQ